MIISPLSNDWCNKIFLFRNMLNHVDVPVDPAKILQDLGKFLASFRTYKVKKGSWTTFFLVVNHGLPQIKHSIFCTCHVSNM